MKITIPNERPPTWNEMYAGVHWSERRETANAIHWKVLEAVADIEPVSHPVCVTVTVFFERRPYDCDNIPAKLYVDGLKKARVIRDDNPGCVRQVTTVSRIDKNYPRVEIEIVEVSG